MEAGVTCGHCGGQTPLPDDLRAPTFTCRYCRAQLETARYAGESVQVDHQSAFRDEAFDNLFNPFWQPSGSMPQAKVLADVVRPCRGCGQAVTLSLMTVDASASCSHCGLQSTIGDYLTEEQQDALREERHREDTEALRAVKARGVNCRTCGGANPAPGAASGQSTCEHCGAVLLLSDYLPDHVVARARLEQRAMEDVKRAPLACAAALFSLLLIGLIFAAVIGGFIWAWPGSP